MRRIAKLAAVGAIGAALMGFGAPAASAVSSGHHHHHQDVTQCAQDQQSSGLGGLLGVGLGLNALNQCFGSNR
ncbi:hypothetical protein [Nocardiopsis ansamitocini]|uniref:hypothetical protein n=1 Tax=Nocardiopsis ansamitocini TaxID=1670832 RepID=UPI002554820B|nr:hypothetical protein [Nocardiopsis ansamitocini]